MRSETTGSSLCHPADLMIHVISHHDAGWFDFDRDPKIDPATGLPYNLVETPPEFITDHQQALARFQPAPASLLRLDLEHAQLGPLQRTLRAFQARAARQDRGKRPAASGQDAEWRARAPEASQGGACNGSRSARWLDEQQGLPELQSASVSSTRLRCISIESTPASASNRHSRTCRCRAEQDVTSHDTARRRERLQLFTVSVCRQRSGVRVLRTSHQSGGRQAAGRVACGVEDSFRPNGSISGLVAG